MGEQFPGVREARPQANGCNHPAGKWVAVGQSKCAKRDPRLMAAIPSG